MSQKMAIMGDVHYGLRDMSHPAFWFGVKFDESFGALIIMSAERMRELVTEHNIHDIKDLKGMPCYIEVKNNIITFKDLWK